jgi:hypothetical protein
MQFTKKPPELIFEVWREDVFSQVTGDFLNRPEPSVINLVAVDYRNVSRTAGE